MGTGNSSTLINNIAILQIDAFTLLNNSFGGSGYDIACAQNNCPILYHLKKANLLLIKFLSIQDSKKTFILFILKKQSSKTALQTIKITKRKYK
jgi:hypothetical protein